MRNNAYLTARETTGDGFLPVRSIFDAVVQQDPSAKATAFSRKRDDKASNQTGRWTARQRTLVFAIGQIVLIWAIALGFIWAAYREGIKSGKEMALTASASTAAYTRQALNSADLVLRSVQDWVADYAIDTDARFREIMSEERFSRTLRDRIVGTSQINVAVIAAANGDVINTTTNAAGAPTNILGRTAFRSQVVDGAPERTLTTLVQNPAGRWTFYMSRRLTGKSGAVIGVVIVGLDSEYFSNLFRQISPLGDEAITLFLADGALLATTVRNPALLGQRFPQSVSRRMVNGGRGGTVELSETPKWHDQTDREPRLIAPRWVDDFPVLVSATIPQSVYLAALPGEAALALGCAVALTLLTIFVASRFLGLLGRSEMAGRLAAERRLLATLIDTPSAMCAVLDRKGGVLYANRRFNEVLGKDLSPGIFDDPRLLGGIEVGRFASAQQRPPIEVDLRMEGVGHQPRFLRFSLSHQALPGLGDCTVMIGHDETERFEAQQRVAQSSKLATLGELTTGMAHEITQPLNVMRLAAQNALMEVEEGAPMDDEFRAFIASKLNRIVGQVDRAADIVSRMRIFGRAPKGPPAEFDARDACHSAIRLIEARARTAEINVVADLGEEPLMLRGHQNLLEMVLVNLLVNAKDALEASEEPHRKIQVTAFRSDTGRVCVTVGDNGPGIPRDIRDRIFDPFFTAKPAGKGAGLGLATSFGVVRDAGGHLSIQSADKGAVFQIELPAAA